jgi:hypothetical protein
MSFLGGLFGAGRGVQTLELKRLKAVAASLGETEVLEGLKEHTTDEQIRLLNRHFGDRLMGCAARDRTMIQSAFAAADRVLPTKVRSTRSSAISPAAQSVIETGCADIGQGLSADQVREVHAHLETKRVLLCHVPDISSESVASLADVPDNENYATYEFLDLWSSPHLLEFAAQDRLLDVAQAYLGCAPTLYSVNAFWSFPNRQPHPYSQLFHRDWEDFRSLAVFTLLTPVDTPEEGAHYYVERSHTLDRFEPALRERGIDAVDVQSLLGRDNQAIAPVAMKLFGDGARRFEGPAGSSFCGDGYGLHRAVVPHSRPRLLLWFRYGNFFNETMYTMPLRGATRAEARRVLARIPKGPRHRYVFRYMIEALRAV